MHLRHASVGVYAADLAALLERYGGILQRDPLRGVRRADGWRRLRLLGVLPGAAGARAATVELREDFVEGDPDWLERVAYAYELVDRSRDFRLAYHFHDPDWFEDRHLVLVHEHCERPIGRVQCAHYEGSPMRDGFAGIAALMAAWIGEAPDCSARRCLE